MSDEQQFCAFIIDDIFLGIEVSKVQEVLRLQTMTRVPLSSPVIAGLINLRGQIVTAIDLRQRLELPARSDDAPHMNVVVRTSEGAVSLLVDEIADVYSVNSDAFERPPETLIGAARDLIRGVYKLNDALLLVLDIEKTVNVGTPVNAGVMN